MRLKVTDDNNFLQVVDCAMNEIEQLEYSMTKKVDNFYIMKKKIPSWDGEIKYIDTYNRIPIGLWQEVCDMAVKFNISLHIDGLERIYDKLHDFTSFSTWAIDYFSESDKTPRDYQIEAANRVLKFKKCTEEISTSGGKTLIAFLLFKYLLDIKKNGPMLYVVPSVSLVTQSEEKFYEYEDECNKRPNWKSQCAFGGARHKEEGKVDIIFGTYQTLAKKPPEYFEQFGSICIDETHHARNISIKNILVRCINANYKFGLTGTLPQKGSNDSFTIQAYIGPKVYTISSADLIASGKATPINVIGIELNYLDDNIKKKLYDLRNVKSEDKDGAKLLNLEKDVARESRKRFKYIVEKVASSKKNSLVLFSDIKNNYGRKIYDWIKMNTEKSVYYIDGGSDNSNRDYYKKQMELNDDTIIVASVGTFSEGIDILNLYNIFVVESYKSEFIVRQVLGRGMRLMEGKDKVMVIDFIDNFEFGSGFQKKNYLMRHGEDREKIYKEKRFPYKRFKVSI